MTIGEQLFKIKSTRYVIWKHSLLLMILCSAEHTVCWTNSLMPKVDWRFLAPWEEADRAKKRSSKFVDSLEMLGDWIALASGHSFATLILSSFIHDYNNPWLAQALDIQYSCSQMVPEVELGMILHVHSLLWHVWHWHADLYYVVMCITALNFVYNYGGLTL